MLVGKFIGWVSITLGAPIGVLMAAVAESPWEAGTWMAGGFAGLVAGYLLVWFIPKQQQQHSETLKAIATEHRIATEKAVEGNTKAFNDAAHANNASFNEAADKIVNSHERMQRIMMKMFAKAAGLDIGTYMNDTDDKDK